MKSQHTILVVDDTELNINILLVLLEDFNVLVALNGSVALELAAQGNIDLILLDILMPGIDGYETCRRLKANPKTKDIPVVFSTAKTDEESIAEAYEAGGIDYVTKPFKPMELIARVKTQLQLRDSIEELRRLSSFDSLTQIYNRRMFFQLAEELFNQKRPNTFAMMIDIDNFKRINDTWGHGVGDEVIRTTAVVLKDKLPEQAIVARLGGEEFAVLCYIEERQLADMLAESIRETIERTEIAADEETVHFTISLGLSWQTEKETRIDELLAQSDKLLYDAKHLGRNCVVRVNR